MKKAKNNANDKLLGAVKNFKVGVDLNSAKIDEKYENRITGKSEDGYSYVVDDGIRYFFELIKSGDKKFTLGATSKLVKNSYNSSVDGLLFRMRKTNMNPSYQRGLVWTESDKRNLIDALVQGRSIGAITFAKNDFGDEFLYEIVDGKQRLSALAEFVADGFSYQNIYFSELSEQEQSFFLNASVAVIDVSFSNDKEKIEYFIELNSAGVKVSDEFLENLKQKIK